MNQDSTEAVREERRNYFYPEFESKNGISLYAVTVKSEKMSENWSDGE